jgi:hypothetical protein
MEVRNASHVHGSNRSRDFQSILCVVIQDEELGCGLVGKCFAQLLDNPTACRMLSNIRMQDASTVVADEEEAIEQVKGERRDGEEIHGDDGFAVIAQKGPQRLAGSGFLGARLIQREMVVSDTSNPSIRNSPWIRGAPQLGFSVTIRKINARASLEILRPPPTRFRVLQSIAQYSLNPDRCQRTTVSGRTRTSASFH